MQQKRLDSIRRIPSMSIELLKQEVVTESKADTTAKIKCPHCFYPMEKVRLESPASLTIDVCGDCNHIWLDGGELARIQLAYECSNFGRDQIELRHRYESLTPEEKEALQRRIDKLPKLNPSGLDEENRRALALFQLFLS